MRVFITGATGWIGSAAVDELAGHELTGLARSDESARALEAKGIRAVRGSLQDLDIIRRAANASDAVLHLGFVHDFDRFAESGRIERAAVQAIGDTLAGSGRAFLLAAGVAGLTPGRVATEADRSRSVGPESPRGGSENLALKFVERDVRVVPLRFAPTVHGPGDHGFSKVLVEIARRRGAAGYVGEGQTRWAAVARSDVGALIALALAKAPAGLPVHAVAEEGITTRAIAEEIGRLLDVPVVSVAPERAAEHFGWIGAFFGMDVAASSERTRQALGWEPTGATLFEDLPHYL